MRGLWQLVYSKMLVMSRLSPLRPDFTLYRRAQSRFGIASCHAVTAVTFFKVNRTNIIGFKDNILKMLAVGASET
jgi:hypothetical protein